MNHQIKIAILLCDKFEFAKKQFENMPEYESLFINMLKGANRDLLHNLKIDVFYVKDMIYPQDINLYDKYIVTGSSSSAYDKDTWIVKLKEFINKVYSSNKKLIGVCFGHQVLAEALGGKVLANSNGKSVGKRQTFIVDDFLKKALKKDTYVLEYHHGDCVVSLPKNVKVLSSCEHCNIDGFMQEGKILSFQGHPEFDLDFADIMFNSVKETYTSSQIDRYYSSQSISSDFDIIAKLILEF